MTYQDIQLRHKAKYNKTIKTCWIADVKRQLGEKVKKANNRKFSTIINKCPLNFVDNIKLIIKESKNCP